MLVKPEEQADSYKCRTAQKYGIPVVTTAFINASIEQGILQDSDAFLAVGTTKKKAFSSGRIVCKCREMVLSFPLKIHTFLTVYERVLI